MKTGLQVDTTFNQIFTLIKQLTGQKKVELARGWEKEGIETNLSELLQTFSTDELSVKTIDEEVENCKITDV